jgi:hypothetical protein
MHKFGIWALGAALLGAAQFAAAATTPFVGTLSGTDPTFNRPLAGNPPGGLSGVGTAVSYDLLPFYVTAADTFTMRTTSASLSPGTADDTFIVLYQNAFNAGAPLANALQADDDSGPGALSQMSRALAPGVQYYLVVTSFSNGALGDYTGNIQNPGNGAAVLGLVPEPSTAMMMIAALAVGGLAASRRRN